MMKKLFNKNKLSSSICSLGALIAITSLNTVAQPGDLKTEIVGDVETTPNSRPYQVALLMNGRQGCGGTLISKDWVLTAAHCLDSASTSSLTVKVGAHRMSAGDGTTHRVSQIISHENWRGANNITSGYDIAVLRLATPANGNVTPASLPTNAIANQIAAVGEYATVSGWGLTYGGSRTPSDILREVSLPIISNAACSNQLGTNVDNGAICGGGPNGTSACNGDSGGPFAIKSGSKYYSIGTVSWGKNCVGATAFTRTSAYLNWIEAQTGITPNDGTITDTAPQARFTSQVSGNTVSFTNNSTDDNGIASSQWNFGDGNASTDSSPSHTFESSGSFTVTLEVTDTKGQTDSTAATVVIAGDSCSTGNQSTYPAWNALTNYTIGDRVTHQNSNYEATWWSTGAEPTIYTNVWKVVGDTGSECPNDNQAPVSSFSSQETGLSVSFSSTSTDDKAVTNYRWDFGDNTVSMNANPSHTYAVAGSYEVTLTVYDAEGLNHTSSQWLTVKENNGNDGCDGLEEWSISKSYALGDKVSYKGAKYDAIWWSTGASPEIYNNVWYRTGYCQ